MITVNLSVLTNKTFMYLRFKEDTEFKPQTNRNNTYPTSLQKENHN